MKIVVWGTGYIANKLFDEIERSNKLVKDEILFCCDNNVLKQGMIFRGVKVESPDRLKVSDEDYLIIANNFQAEIREQIKKENLISESKVTDYGMYLQLIYTRKQYFKRYGKNFEGNTDDVKYKKTIVYTAVMGDYDNLFDPTFVDNDISYICFTNNKELRSDIWNIVYLDNGKYSNVMLARRIKLLPWEYLDCDALTIWVDANLPIRKDLRIFASKYQKNNGMLCFPHSERCCICDEAAAVVSHRPDVKRNVIIQTADYMREGLPVNFGLFETSCMVRDFSNPMIKELMKKWWEELVRYTYRDQISLPYICWKNNYLPDICDQTVWWNEWLSFNIHKNSTNSYE